MSVHHALYLSIAAAISTILLKGGAAWLTGSVALGSDALESFVNLAGALFALAMVTLSRQPADREHPFGHGKAEYFSAGVEGMLIVFAALGIVAAAMQRFFHPASLELPGWGAGLSLVSTVINWAVSKHLLRISKKHHSLALEADAKHLMTDVWTSVGVLLGMALTVMTEKWWLDPLMAVLVAIHILHEGGGLVRSAIDGLMDKALSDERERGIETVLNQHIASGGAWVDLRTRCAGAESFAQVRVRVPGDWTVLRAHDLADMLEHEVWRECRVKMVVHIEPMLTLSDD